MIKYPSSSSKLTGSALISLSIAMLALSPTPNARAAADAPKPPAPAAAAPPAEGKVGVMRDISAKEIVLDMKVGWGLGNTMDASPNETGWGNPVTTQAMIDAVKAMGFKTVRIPVTWGSHVGPAPDYTIDKAWLDRVETIANYVLKDGMYAIVNTHHEGWVKLTAAGQAAGTAEAAKVWAQIATRFKDASDYLILEPFNEPKGTVNQWSGGSPEARTILNAYHVAAVGAIRGAGGNNAKRIIMCCTHAATPSDAAIQDLVIPNNDPRIVLSIHTYYPGGLAFGGQNSWGTDADKAAMRKELDREQKDASTKGSGTAVIGEWGSVSRVDLASRVAHAQYYAEQVRLRGMTCIWWDNGGGDFGILDRRSNPPGWKWPTIAKALVAGAESGLPKPATGEAPKTGMITPDGIPAHYLTVTDVVRDLVTRKTAQATYFDYSMN